MAQANDKHAYARDYIGDLYRQGKDGVEKNIEESQKWYKEAFNLFKIKAEEKDLDAQYQLGIHYLYGHGIKEDIKLASFWLSKARKGGHWEATSIFECEGKLVYDENVEL